MIRLKIIHSTKGSSRDHLPPFFFRSTGFFFQRSISISELNFTFRTPQKGNFISPSYIFPPIFLISKMLCHLPFFLSWVTFWHRAARFFFFFGLPPWSCRVILPVSLLSLSSLECFCCNDVFFLSRTFQPHPLIITPPPPPK